MIGITEFYKKVLPTQGVYCLTTMDREEDGGRTRHYYMETVEEIETQAKIISGSRTTNLFVCPMSFSKHQRSKELAAYFRSIYIDLDIGTTDKKYSSKQEARADFDRFLAETGLPEPVEINSGNGIHMYWVFEEDIPAEEWKLYAEKFKDFCLDKNLKIDTAVYDLARIMRCPNTINYKRMPGLKTNVVSESISVYNFKEFKDFLGEIPERDASFDEIIKAAKKGLSEEERLAQGGSDWESSFDKLLEVSMKGVGCNQIKFMMEQPDQVSYDLWTAGLTVASRCVDAETAIHTLSEKGPTYDREATILKAASFSGVHPCTAFENANPDGCEGCIKRGKITNPLGFAKKLRDGQSIIPIVATEPDRQEEPQEEYEDPWEEEKIGNVIFQDNENAVVNPNAFTLPPSMFPFIHGPNGGVYRVLPGEYNKQTKQLVTPDPVLVCEECVEAIKRLMSESEGDCLEIEVRYKHDKQRKFLYPMKYLYSLEKMTEIMAGRSIIIDRKNLTHFMDYLIAWGQNLKNHRAASIMRTQMGWTDKERTSFVIGDKEFTRDGKIVDSPISTMTREIGPHFKEKGEFSRWQEAAMRLALPGLELHAFSMLAGFASPLMAYGSTHGATICLQGKAGAAKTGALYSAVSIWGDPEALYIHGGNKKGATFNGLRTRLNSIHSMPFTIDEVTNMNAEDLSDTIHMISSGKAKVRTQGSSNAERTHEASANLLAIMTSNHSIYDKLGVAKGDPNGEVARLIEFNIYQPEVLRENPQLGKKIFEVMKHNFGHAGPKFINALYDIENKGEIIRDINDEEQYYGPRFQKWIDKFVKDYGYDPADRFYHNIIAWTFGAGDIANEYGILNNFPLDNIYETVVANLMNIKKNVIQINKIDFDKLLTDFIGKNLAAMLVIKDGRAIEFPSRDLLIRSDDDTNTLYIRRSEFNKYLVEAKVNIEDFKRVAKESTADFWEKKMRLTAGWKDASSSKYNFDCYCFRKLVEDPEDESGPAAGT